MGGRNRPSEPLKTNEQPTDRKKGFADWMNLMKPGNEEKDHWVISFTEGKMFDFFSFSQSFFC